VARPLKHNIVLQAIVVVVRTPAQEC